MIGVLFSVLRVILFILLIFLVVVLFSLIVLSFINIRISLSIGREHFEIVINRVIKINPREKTNERRGKNFLKKFPREILLKMLKSSIPKIRRTLLKARVSLKINLLVGTGDAFHTALVYGVLFSLLYSLEAFLREVLQEFCGTYEIKPDFNKLILDYGVDIKIKIRGLYLFILIFKLFPIYRKYKEHIIRKGGVVNV